MGSPTISFISIGKQKAYLSWLNWKFLIIPLLSFGTWQNCRSAGLSSTAVLHVVNASPSSSLLTLSAVLREVNMLAIATAALIVLATTAEAAFVKNDYGGRESYKHEDSDSYKPSYEHKKGEDYPEPSHKSHYADQYYGHKPSYEVKDYSHRTHHDSYDEDYGRDAYSESSSPSYKQTHESSYRYKRGADKMDNYDEDGKDKKGDKDGDKKGDGEGGDGEGGDGNEPDEDENEVDTKTWVNLADSLSLIARKLADRDNGGEGGNGEEGDDDDDEDDEDDDDEEEMKMSEASTYTYEPIRKSKKYRHKSHEPRSYRNKRSVTEEAGVTESQAMEETMDLVDSLRDGQARKCKCTSKGPNGHHKPCHRKGSNTHNKYFCYVKHKCRGSKPSKHHHGFHWATHTCCGKNKKCRGH